MGPPWTILVNANNEVLEFRAGLPAGFTQFKVYVSYLGGNMFNTSLVQWTSTVGTVWSENQAVNPFPSPTQFGGAYNKYAVADSGWLAYNGQAQSMYGYLLKSGSGTIYGIASWIELQ